MYIYIHIDICVNIYIYIYIYMAFRDSAVYGERRIDHADDVDDVVGHFIHLQDQLTSIGSPNFERIRCEIGILGGAAGTADSPTVAAGKYRGDDSGF